MRKRVLLDLNAEIGDAGVFGCRELALGRWSDPQPISGSKVDGFTVNDRLTLASKNAVNFFVSFMGVDERNTCARRQLVQADFSTGQSQLIMSSRRVWNTA